MKSPMDLFSRLLLAIIFLVFLSSVFVQAQTFDWSVSGNSTRLDEILSITANTDGNIYAAGHTIAPSVSIDTLSGTDTTYILIDTIYTSDILLTAFTNSGDPIWQKTFTGKGNDRATHIVSGSEGNFFVTGIFSDTLMLDDVPLQTSGKFDSDVFTAMMNNEGNIQWVTQVGGNGNANSAGLATDAFGSAYLGFNFRDTINIHDLIVVPPDSYNFAVVKYDNNGALLWHQLGNNETGITLAAINTDLDGNTYAVGYFTGYMTFGGYYYESLDETDAFIAKIDSNGNVEWLKTMAYPGIQSLQSIATGINSELYVCGQTNEPLTVNNDTIEITGVNSAFVARFSTEDGSVQWITPVNGWGVSIARQLSVDADGNAWLAGNFSPTVFYQSDTLNSQGADDVLLAKLNPDGQILWIKTAGGVNSETVNTLAFDAGNQLFFAGAFDIQTNFDADTLTSLGEYDYFLTKIGTSVVTSVAGDFSETPIFNLQSAFRVFPNPANNLVSLALFNIEGPISISLFDLNGSVWKQETLNKSAEVCEIDVSGLPKGIYLIQVLTSTQQATSKLIVR